MIKDEFLMLVRFWDPVNWKLSEIHDVYMNKTQNSKDFIEALLAIN